MKMMMTMVVVVVMIQSKKMREAGQVTYVGEMRNAYKILVRKPELKRSFGK
jgi:hypothetical protein